MAAFTFTVTSQFQSLLRSSNQYPKFTATGVYKKLTIIFVFKYKNQPLRFLKITSSYFLTERVF